MKKKILGLDLGTNSIGWALVEQDFDDKSGKIIDMGSRIIPMSEDILGKFDSGVTESGAAARTGFRGVRRLRERHLLRRERLHRVLNILGYLPDNYKSSIDFEKRFGQFLNDKEPKLAYNFNEVNNSFEFLFKDSFNEMLEEFKVQHPHLLNENKKIPYDWTIYFLRKKALEKKIEKEELAWLLLSFNQKRGYYQLRGEDDEDTSRTAKTRIYFEKEVIESITDSGKEYKGNKIFEILLRNGSTGKLFRKEMPAWHGIEKNIIVTVDLDKEGKDKYDEDNKLSQRFSIPSDEDWEKQWKLIKIKTENDLKKSEKTVGQYIYDTLLCNPTQKIKGKLVRVIERKFYKEELRKILETQIKYHAELLDDNYYIQCIEELYGKNDAHRENLKNRDFQFLFLEDIIFYQRPLKSKKSEISDCKFEIAPYYIDRIRITKPLKCISKSHPLYQEYRLWQWIQNLNIYERDNDEISVLNQFIKSENDFVLLFDFLNSKKEIDQKTLFKSHFKISDKKYRWNFVEEKAYPCNETRYQMQSKLSKVNNVPNGFLTREKEVQLWHILYSVNDNIEIHKALTSFATKNCLGEDFIIQFKKFPPYKNDYGSFSSKAIKKLLSLMRMGKYWNSEEIDSNTITRIKAIINGEVRNDLSEDIREKTRNLISMEHFQGLPQWLASYIVYNRHSEDANAMHWKTIKHLENYLKEFKQHSLRNPIVEQVITETLRVVKDIWEAHGQGKENYFDEIHIELGREMKNPSNVRKEITNKMIENENTNQRIKVLLVELFSDSSIENVRPFSPSQQEILRIYEEGALSKISNEESDILKISKLSQPTKKDLERYKLWLEQNYRSPYTGKSIPLNKLFTPAYEIEHIIPQSRFFDDSFSNKVICESAVNKLKNNQLGLEFIKAHRGEKVQIDSGKSVEILSEAEYEQLVKSQYGHCPGKKKKLLMEDIPEKFVERQMNDSRYISKLVKNLLSNLVRKDSNDNGTTSVNLLSSNGQITSILKRDWALNDIWNDIISPRFERMNIITETNNYGSINENTNKFLPKVPLSESKNFSKKRIDHRHHALDALIIACATTNHINYLNNKNAVDKTKSKDIKQREREDLKRLLCSKLFNEGSDNNYKWVFKQPWNTFTIDAKAKLLTTIVSFKQNLRVINKTVNHYQHWEFKNGILEKEYSKQTIGKSWAIRKPLHKDTVSGLVKLRFTKEVQLKAALEQWESIADKKIRQYVKQLVNKGFDKQQLQTHFKNLNNKLNEKDISKVNIYYWENENVASRVKLDESFNLIKIQSITDSGIKSILRNHLNNEKYNNLKDENGKITPPELLAFSPDGIDELNKNIQQLNGGKIHQPIYKIRTFEPKGKKFAVGVSGNKKHKYVEAAKGTNLFFAIYINGAGKRSYSTIPLNEVIEIQMANALLKNSKYSVPQIDENGNRLLFHLSPNDLVYLPTAEEIEHEDTFDFSTLTNEQVNRIYKMVSSSGTQCFFIKSNVAISIVNKKEFSALNKMEKSVEEVMIKDQCWKIKISRIGKITKVIH